MTRTIGYMWHLRRLMAERGLFATTELAPLLAERGIRLSREQVYRLVARAPERLNLAVLVALCDILDCQAGDLIEPVASTKRKAKRPAGAPAPPTPPTQLRPRRAKVLPAATE